MTRHRLEVVTELERTRVTMSRRVLRGRGQLDTMRVDADA